MVQRNININITGNASQVNSVLQSISANATAAQNQLNALQTAQARISQTGARNFYSPQDVPGEGARIVKLRENIEQVGNAFRVVEKAGVTYEGRLIGITGTTKTYTGNVTSLTAALQQLEVASKRVEAANRQVAASHTVAQNSAGRYIDAITKKYLNAQQVQQSFAAQEEARLARRGFGAANRGVISAFGATPDVPDVFRNLPTSVTGRLRTLGLDVTSANDLINKNAFETFSVTRDAIRQVNRLTGTFGEHGKALNRVAIEYTDAGKVITRFGGNLSGFGNVLSQIGRDFQKVIEFAIATTVVFGALRKAIQEIELINQVEKSVRQLSITANVSRREAFNLFSDIADIAISTATPVQELVKATDDIALATRRAGQSTAEWKEEILSLTQSVGILTNLAGIDTVRATDLLVSTMKQLNLEADQLPAILNKITAVAGGQSNAIADIIQGLGVMAEAASQANLSIDETIATVQTLSQVTAKSPAEIATAFKNLVGSVDSSGAKKALAEFGITLRDGAGNLRSILDIYREISEKIEQGVIPADRVKELVKAIAGGPRRAPDAAALLSNINEIQIVAERSIAATNEALIANAKILDTTSAKLAQIQARVDKFAVTKFADIVREGATALAGALDVVLDLLELIPTQAITSALAFGTLLVAIKLGLTTGRLFAGTIVDIIGRLNGMTGALVAATTAQRGLNQAQQSGLVNQFGQPITSGTAPVGGLFAGTRGTFLRGLGTSALFGAATGAFSAASGANPASSIGAGLQGAGIAALLNPIPIPQVQVALKALGAAALGVGTILQVVAGSAKDEQRARESNTEALLNAIGQYNQANLEVSNLQTRQEELASSINKMRNETELTAEGQLQLRTAQQDYAETTVNLIDATSVATKAFQDLSTELGTRGYRAALVRAGQFDPARLKEIATELTAEILDINLKNFTLPPIRPGSYNIPASGFTTVEDTRIIKGGGKAKITVDLTSIGSDELKKLFDENLIDKMVVTIENLDLISQALEDAAENGTIAEDVLKKYTERLNDIAAASNAIGSAQRVVTQYSAYLQAQGALGIIKIEDVEQGQALLDIYLKLIEAGKNLPSQLYTRSEGQTTPLVSEGQFTQQDFQQFVQERIFDGDQIQKIGRNTALALFEGFTKAKPASSDEFENLFEELMDLGTFEQTAASFFSDSGYVVEGLTNISIAAQQANDNLAELIIELGEAKDAALANFAQKSADLRAQFQGGAITSDEYAEQYDQLLRVSEGFQAVADSFENVVTLYGEDGKDAIDIFTEGLSNVIGLQNAQKLQLPDLINRLFDLASTYNLTGEQVLQLVDKLLVLETSLKRLAEIREIVTRFNVQVNAAGLKGLADAIRLQAKVDAARQSGRLGEKVNPRSDLLKYADELDAIIAGIEGASAGVGDIYRSGSGTRTGTSSSRGRTGRAATAKGPDVSTIDLPKEIANAMNRDALIQEAIKRAKALQAQIPGASAEARDDIVELLKGTQRILEVRGVKDDLLRKALEELADIEKQRLEFETRADTISRIRVGAGSFAAFANVPLNTATGVSVGGPQGPITVNLNISGQVLTPAQFDQLADKIGAAIKNQIANG